MMIRRIAVMKKLLSLLLCISVLLGITGCNAVDKAEDAFNGFMVTMGICDFDGALNFVDKDKYGESFSVFKDNMMYLTKFFDDMSYEILSSQKVDSDNVNITVRITAIEMKPILHTLYEETAKLVNNSKFSDVWEAEDKATARVEKLLGRIAMGSDLSTVSSEIVVKVSKKDGKWLVVPDAVFMEAVSGGFEKALASVTDLSAKEPTPEEAPAQENTKEN